MCRRGVQGFKVGPAGRSRSAFIFLQRTRAMKNPLEVLRRKEQELLKVKKEIDALRITVRLLGEEKSPAPHQKMDLRQMVEMP
jgi:hypothetical protein